MCPGFPIAATTISRSIPISGRRSSIAFFISTGVVALGEIGDKTQLLALLLAARFRRPVPIIFGILVATLLNHASCREKNEQLATAWGLFLEAERQTRAATDEPTPALANAA